jgi:hypothetical protein
MMRNNNCNAIRSGVFKRLNMALFGLVVLVASGCGSGGSGDGVIIAVLPFEGSLKLQADFMDTGQTTGGFVFNFGPQLKRPPFAAGDGADISLYQSLKFSIDASAVANFANLTIQLRDTSGNVALVNLANYVPSVSRTWNSYAIPLIDFPGVVLTDVVFLGFWDARDSLDVLVFGKLDFDDIHFVDAAGATLAVYSETSIDLVLFYNEIIYGDDAFFGGNTTYAFDSVNGLTLPTDLVLNLYCVNAGVYDPRSLQNPPDPANGDPTCILNDPENPFRTATIPEFDANNPNAPTKFDILPPDGPDPCAVPPDPPPGDPSYMPLGEKAEFYFWATALARRPSGENQYYVARALHRLWTVNTDPIVQQQAKRAYRSVLDYFFDDPTFFSTRDFNPNCAEPEIFYAVKVRHETGKLLYNTDPLNPPNLLDPERAHLYPGLDPGLNGFRALSDMADWGYGFDIANELVFKF